MLDIPTQASLDDIIKQTGLPSDIKWVGYGVHIPASDEFVSKIKNIREGVAYVYAATPELAKIWKSPKGAIKTADSIKFKYPDARLVIILDIGEQLVVMSQDDIRH